MQPFYYYKMVTRTGIEPDVKGVRGLCLNRA